MAIYLKKFENHTQYENYINGSDAILPNVSICTTEGDVHYNPYVPPTPVETRVVAKFNVTDTSNPTQIIGEYSKYPLISAIEIDGVEQPSVVKIYTFSTTGEHTVKYTLTDPTTIAGFVFDYCNSLTSIVIPNSVTSISSGAFRRCSSLTSIVCNATIAPTIESDTFYDVKTGGTLTVPSGSSGYDVWMGTGNYYLGMYNWTKVEQ